MVRMPVTVIKPKDLVISVQRSGTRTLRKHLGLKTNTHFGQQSAKNLDAAEMFHIPIRHPSDVAAAWARRGESLDKLLNTYGLMFEFLDRQPKHKLYRIEDFEPLDGTDEPGKCDKSVTEAYQNRVMRLVVEPHREFFEAFYAL